MAVFRDQGVVLRTHKLGEADRIITVLSKQHGLLRLAAKGVRKTSSKFGARLEPFSVVDFQAYSSRTLGTVTQAETLAMYGPAITQDLAAYAAASVMTETALQLTEVEASLHQFNLLVGGLAELARKNIAVELIRDSYLLRALALAGWALELKTCANCGMVGDHSAISVQHGGVLCENCAVPGLPRLTANEMRLLQALVRGAWQVAEAATTLERDHVSGVVSAFTRWQLERGLKSLTVAEQAQSNATYS